MDITNGMVLNSEENAIQILEELEKKAYSCSYDFFWNISLVFLWR